MLQLSSKLTSGRVLPCTQSLHQTISPRVDPTCNTDQQRKANSPSVTDRVSSAKMVQPLHDLFSMSGPFLSCQLSVPGKTGIEADIRLET